MNLRAIARRLVTRAAPSSWHNCRTSPPPLWEPVQFRDTGLLALSSSWAQLYGLGVGHRGQIDLDGGGKATVYCVNGCVMLARDAPPGLEWRAMP